MTKIKAINKIKTLVCEGIEIGDYRKINYAFDLAYAHDIFMAEDENCIQVEDDVFYFEIGTF